MLPLFLLLVIGWQYFQLTTGKASSNQEIVSNKPRPRIKITLNVKCNIMAASHAD